MFRLLFGIRNDRLHLRALARQSGLGVSTVRQELKRLVRLRLVLSEAQGNRTYYRANQDHLLHPEFQGMVVKTMGLMDVLRAALREAPVQVAFIFGLTPKTRQQLPNKLDVMVIGPITARDLSKRMTAVSRVLDQGIKAYCMTAEEFKARKKSRDKFLSAALAKPPLFIVGNKRSLSKLR